MRVQDPPKWLRFIPTSLLPWGAKTFWALFGGTIVLLAMRLIVVDQLKAEVENRVVADSALAAHDTTASRRMDTLKVQIDTIRTNQKINIRAVCLDHTKGQQALIGVNCPAYLYRGAN